MTGGKGSNTLPQFTGNITAKSRANFTHYHLIAASHAYQEALSIENKYNTETPPQKELNLYIAHFSACIMCSVAALESKINEHIVDNETEINSSRNRPLFKIYELREKAKKRDLTLSESLLSATNAFKKFNIIWHIKYGGPYLEDEISRNVKYLIEIRNALIHFTPEWNDAFTNHSNLDNVRNDLQFTESPFFPKDTFFIPHRCLSASCAEWSVGTSKNFLTTISMLCGCIRVY